MLEKGGEAMPRGRKVNGERRRENATESRGRREQGAGSRVGKGRRS
jgi:hypothetical protein